MTVTLHVHDTGCRYALLGDGTHEDAAKRVTDGYNLHRVAGGYDTVGKILAFRIQDGTSDGVAYDNKPQAVAHQRHNERYCMFVRVRTSSMTVCEAATLLRSARMLYDLGNRPDRSHPNGGLDLIPRLTSEHQVRQDMALLRSLRHR